MSVHSDDWSPSLPHRRPLKITNPRTPDSGQAHSNAHSGSFNGNHLADVNNDNSGSGSSNEELLVRVQDLEKLVNAMQALLGISKDRWGVGRKSVTSFDQGEAGRLDGVTADEEPRTITETQVTEIGVEKGWKLDVRRFKRVNNREGFFELYDASSKIEDIRRQEQDIRSGGYVLSVYDEHDLDGKQLQTLLEIHSTALLDLLRQVIKFYPGDDFDILSGKDQTDDTVTFASPYMMFFSYRKQLVEALDSDKYPDEAKEHLNVLLNHMKKEHPITSAKLTEIEEGRCKKIAFQLIWLLYPPNASVYSFKGADKRQIAVYSHQAQDMSTGPSRMKVICWEVLYEQGVFKRDFDTWNIEPYSGEKAIHNLELVPARYVANETQLREDLIARGRRYFELNKSPSLQDYYGNKFPRVFKDEPVRVVVDEGTYWRQHPPRVEKDEDPSQDYGFPKGEEDLVDGEGQPLDTTFLRCFPEVGVFSLRNKDWALVKVDDLQPVNFREKAFRRLVIRDDYKRIVKAMVHAFKLPKPGFSDLVYGKGRGLTVLLHGPPECVAEKHKCPLFTISCGDLGTDPGHLESRLKQVFQYAVTWKAILLLDEADIFLQERDVHDVQRNALVSVFLRELDFFEGILFLSTNRPGEIDEAFVSRIHITLGLSSLTREAQEKVWSIFIRDLDLNDKQKRDLMAHVRDKFRDDNLNGRQIRNTVRTALALAQLHQESVSTTHLDDVMKMVREYTEYLRNLNGVSAGYYAFATGRRGPSRQGREDGA